jgi:serine/threonine-protein kinase
VDGRSDIYSLGCVVFEMITGVPPFRGATPGATMSHHQTSDPPSLRTERRSCPSTLDDVVRRALAKAPADRFRTAGEFVRALESPRPIPVLVDALESAIKTPVSGPVVETRRTPENLSLPKQRGLIVAGSLAVSILAVASIALAVPEVRGFVGSSIGITSRNVSATLDTFRFAVLPVGSNDSLTPAMDVAELLRESFRRWRGINVVDAFHVRDALARRPSGALADNDARRAATVLGAGRYVRLQVSRLGDSLRVRAALFDTRTNSSLVEKSVWIAAELRRADAPMAQLADSLLFPIGMPRARSDATIGTTSLPARRAYLRGHAALQQWNLALADSEFRDASELDAQYAQAYLWLAQVRSWRWEPPARWRFAAEKAAASHNLLSRRDSLLSVALVALGGGRRDQACREWTKLTVLDSYDFAGWYGLGNCLAYDSAVARDPRSPSGFRFRSSYSQALNAYERAFRLLPSIHESFHGGPFGDFRRLFMTSSDQLRPGVGMPPDTTHFLAYPTWQGDSLSFVPQPAQSFHAARGGTMSSAVNDAVLHQRQRFHQVATMWRAAVPQSVHALEAVSVALELLGDASALDTLRIARRRATTANDQIRMGVSEVWMRLKFSLPTGNAAVVIARDLADSLLAAHRPSDPQEASLLGSLAALRGRAVLAATYSRMADLRSVPTAIAQTAPALVAYAAMGGPVDSLHALEQFVERAIVSSLVGTEREAARSVWLIRAAALAVPNHQFESVPLMAAGSYRVRLLSAWRNRDLIGAQRTLADLRNERQRGSIRPWDVTTDGLYAEAAILAALGDERGAIVWMAPTLDSISFGVSGAFANIPRAGSLMRAMALRAELEDRVGDKVAARKWAKSVAILWSGADDFLKPTVARMKRLAN